MLFLLQEIEEKAPVLQKQREDYEQALETVSQLSSKLEAAMLVRRLDVDIDDDDDGGDGGGGGNDDDDAGDDNDKEVEEDENMYCDDCDDDVLIVMVMMGTTHASNDCVG